MIDLDGFTPETSSVALVATMPTDGGSKVGVVNARVVDLMSAVEVVPSAWWPKRVIEHQRAEDEAREVARLAAVLHADKKQWFFKDAVSIARDLLAEARNQVAGTKS